MEREEYEGRRLKGKESQVVWGGSRGEAIHHTSYATTSLDSVECQSNIIHHACAHAQMSPHSDDFVLLPRVIPRVLRSGPYFQASRDSNPPIVSRIPDHDGQNEGHAGKWGRERGKRR